MLENSAEYNSVKNENASAEPALQLGTIPFLTRGTLISSHSRVNLPVM
jgi:hypothetical protein